jgi:O-antigen/teichoic acid export membrane protein
MIAALRYLRLQGFDTSTVEGRDAERYRRAGWAVLSNVGSRAISMLLVILSVHLTVPYLGTTRFGVWATFASMAGMLSLLDLGVGNALVNRVARASATGDKAELQQVVTGGCGILAVIGLASAALLFGVAEVIPWGRVFKLRDAALIEEARKAGAVFAACFGINLFSAGLLRVLAGQQRLHAANLVSAAGTAIACLALVLASGRQVSIPWLIASTFGFQAGVSLFAGVLLHRADMWRFRQLRPAMRRERSHLLRTGSLFMLLQLGTMIGWGSDSVVLASLKGAGEVAVFAVAMRLFQFASQPFAVVNIRRRSCAP